MVGDVFQRASGVKPLHVQAAARREVWRDCCDAHSASCEPPSGLCCSRCTEAHHGTQWWLLGQHDDGSPCVLDGEP